MMDSFNMAMQMLYLEKKGFKPQPSKLVEGGISVCMEGLSGGKPIYWGQPREWTATEIAGG